MNKEKIFLMVLDGFGEGKDYKTRQGKRGNVIKVAGMKNFENLRKKYPSGLLDASGEAVGLPKGVMGNSEVGHYTIGSGRIIFQSLEEINRSIRLKEFLKKKPLLEAIQKVKNNQKTKKNPINNKAALHLIGMISDAGVHSHLNHLYALLELAKKHQCFPIYIHAITDGRDVPERTAKKYLAQINKKIKELKLNTPVFKDGPAKASIATIIGRYFAMDRDKNYDRTKAAYLLYTQGIGTYEKDPLTAIDKAYKRGIKTDYYIDPIILADTKNPKSAQSKTIKSSDSVIFFNFRTDRPRQLTNCFTFEADQTTMKKFKFAPDKKLKPFFVVMGPYSRICKVVFPAPNVKNNLSESLACFGIRQLHIAETEKYAHVTYFFNSQTEKPFPKEDRIMVASPKVTSFAEKPQMSAYELTKRCIQEVEKNKHQVIIQNYANPDLVGHSGNYQAAIKACHVIDECIKNIADACLKNNYHLIITADHGNIEEMLYRQNSEPCPSHTVNPVPIILISDKLLASKIAKGKGLKDVAPTILKILNIKKPKEMTGESII